MKERKHRTVMDRRTSAALFSFGTLIILIISCGPAAAEPVHKETPLAVYFSPHGGATEALVREVSTGRKEILVQAYSLSSQPIVKALLAAHQRGLSVKIIIDKSERGEGLTPAVLLANAGVPVFLDGSHALAHSNCLIIDRSIVITGSFNFTKASEESNAEDLLIIRSAQLAERYRRNWDHHRAHAEPY